MSRLLQVIIALVGLAITGVLGLASERNQALQVRHTLIGLFTETVATARTTCDGDLAEMAEFSLAQLENLESKSVLLLTPEDRADRQEMQNLLAEYQDIMARVKGTIDSGSCRPTAAPVGGEVLAAPAPDLGTLSAPAPGATPPATANLEFRRAERLRVPSEILREGRVVLRDAARTDAPADVTPAPPASGTPSPGASDTDTRAPSAAAVSGGYYAVLASYAPGEEATYDPERGLVAQYRRLSAAAREENLTVSVFQASASNHFAIVLVPEGLSRENARDLVAMARARGWSRDAFVQASREWTPCPRPEQISRRQDCGAAVRGR